MKDKSKNTLSDRDNAIFDEIIMYLKQNALETAEKLICHTFELYPHRPEPHNFMGILLEKKSDHDEAMIHFRIALELEPTYLPAQYNLMHYGTFYDKGHCAYREEDCSEDFEDDDILARVVYGQDNIGHLFRRKK